MTLLVPVSVGEVVDKITILQIKAENIKEPEKLKNVVHELRSLLPLIDSEKYQTQEITGLMTELRTVNQSLWTIEDRIREKEAAQSFDEDFIELARAVYITNDRRAEIKKKINLATGSDLVEEKSYEHY